MTREIIPTPWTRQFSRPDTPGDDRIFDTVVNAHDIAVVQWLLHLYSNKINLRTDGLVDRLSTWTANPGPSDTAWDIAFGRVHLAIREGRLEDPTDASVRLGLRIAQSGRRGNWSGRLSASPVMLNDMLIEGVHKIQACDSPNEPLRTKPSLVDGTQCIFELNED